MMLSILSVSLDNVKDADKRIVEKLTAINFRIVCEVSFCVQQVAA